MTDPTTTEAAPPKSGFGWKQVIAGVVTLAVLAVIFIGIFPQFANYQKAFDSIAAMTVPWMVTQLCPASRTDRGSSFARHRS